MISKKYLLNCFLLLIPILLWNILLTPYLPEGFAAKIFWENIPSWICIGENSSGIVIMVAPLFLVLSLKKNIQRVGLMIYSLGVFVYFISWIMLIVYPLSNWSQSVWGFTAPAYTPILWLIGIGLIGRQSFLPIKNTTVIYIALSALFTFFHTTHAFIVYEQL